VDGVNKDERKLEIRKEKEKEEYNSNN